MQWKSASKAIKCHCDLAWDTSPSLKNAQWTIKKEDTFQCFSVSLPVVVGLTFFSVVFKTSCCLLCTEEYYSCFYKLYVIKFHSGFGGLSHHCLREILCEDKKNSPFCCVWYDEEFVWALSQAPNKEYLKPLGFLKYLCYTLDLVHCRPLRLLCGEGWSPEIRLG